MRKYGTEIEQQLEQVVCNQCKRELKVEKGYVKEGCFTADFCFGYFSKRDGIRHRFDLCEDCYNKMVAGFQIPVEEVLENELL